MDTSQLVVMPWGGEGEGGVVCKYVLHSHRGLWGLHTQEGGWIQAMLYVSHLWPMLLNKARLSIWAVPNVHICAFSMHPKISAGPSVLSVVYIIFMAVWVSWWMDLRVRRFILALFRLGEAVMK